MAVVLVLTFSGPGRTIEPQDVERVAAVLDKLADQGVSIAYDEETAAELFERDAGDADHIGAAGFSRDAWMTAFDSTMKAFLATFSESEREDVFRWAQSYEQRYDMSETQKEALRALVADRRAMMDRWRLEGAANAELVRPYSPRIRAALGVD